ncbi:MAG: hypothetical protein O3B47_02925 [bacterium]|nr:hypothetical protein [bacterium]
MPDENSQSNQGGQGPQTDGSAGPVVDKNKSAEQYILEAEAKYIVPALVREKFPDLIKLIHETESMNQEEREYWLQIMPIMSEDQIVKFRDILVNEKQQLEKLDAEYENEMSRINSGPQIDPDAVKKKMESMKQAEASHEATEKEEEAELLRKLGNV